MSVHPETHEAFNKALATLFTDDDAHVIHDALWGGVDPTGHNRQENGEPFGDCYKCRVIRDAIHERLRSFDGMFDVGHTKR